VTPVYEQWQAFVDARCDGTAASGGLECIQAMHGVAGAVKFMDLLTSLSAFANSTILICVLGCFCVLVAVTWNVIVSLYATVTVAFVIAGVMGCIIAAGLKDGMYENVFTILVVGMAIDYAVHLAHFYNEATGTRFDKAQEAMYGVGGSVLGGAITTIGAGVPLFFCVVMFFFVQGLFIFYTALCALFFAFFFLIPLLMIAGPEGRLGDLRVCFPCLEGRRKVGSDSKSTTKPATQDV